MRHALFLPPFGELADPRAMVDLVGTAAELTWDGLFLWDHVLRPSDEPAEVADTWIQLAAVATATSRIRLGPMITPIVRRRPQKLAREAVTLDHLSEGRLTLGLGLGVDHGGELTRFGEVTDPRARGDVLDEGAALLTELWSGDEVTHRGEHFTADGVRFRPVPVQRPRIPLWFPSNPGGRRPVRRAAHYDGLFPIRVGRDDLARMVDIVVAERGGLDGFDIAVLGIPGVDLDALEAVGASWTMWSFLPGEPLAEVRAAVESGPGSTAWQR